MQVRNLSNKWEDLRGTHGAADVREAGVRVATRGVAITTGASSASAAIPDTAAGAAPRRVRLAATAACYARLGAPSEGSAVMAAPGTAHAPGDLITLAGGTYSTPMKLEVATTKAVSATVAAGGAGDLGDGAGVIVEGTTGTGTKFRASVTITANAIASVQSISLAGSYSVNPTDIANEPVTYISGASSGAELTGAALNVVMGADTVTVSDPGAYTVEPSNPVAQAASTGSGVDATFTVTWATPAAGDILVQPGGAVIVDAIGFDHVAAIQVDAAGILQVSPIED